MRLLTRWWGIALLAATTMSISAQEGEKFIKDSDCSSCHALDHAVVGPAYRTIAGHYAGQSDGLEKVSGIIKDGRSGMPAHPKLTDAQRQAMATWILAQIAPAGGAPAAESKTYSYKLKDGSAVALDFQLFLEGQGPKVTKSVFHGYQLYNSYCYRCHGTDASGGQLAPDLRHSLSVGMGQPGFLSVAMTGKEATGMPAWAGFLSEEDVVDVFRYVKGRSLDLIPSGRPPSAQD